MIVPTGMAAIGIALPGLMSTRAPATTRSPAFRWDSIAPCTAAMPVAVTRQASAPSISASRSSSMATVGLPKREYW